MPRVRHACHWSTAATEPAYAADSPEDKHGSSQAALQKQHDVFLKDLDSKQGRAQLTKGRVSSHETAVAKLLRSSGDSPNEPHFAEKPPACMKTLQWSESSCFE